MEIIITKHYKLPQGSGLKQTPCAWPVAAWKACGCNDLRPHGCGKPVAAMACGRWLQKACSSFVIFDFLRVAQDLSVSPTSNLPNLRFSASPLRALLTASTWHRTGSVCKAQEPPQAELSQALLQNASNHHENRVRAARFSEKSLRGTFPTFLQSFPNFS